MLDNFTGLLHFADLRSLCLWGAFTDPTDSHGEYEAAGPKMLANWLDATQSRLRQHGSVVSMLSGISSLKLQVRTLAM